MFMSTKKLIFDVDEKIKKEMERESQTSLLQHFYSWIEFYLKSINCEDVLYNNRKNFDLLQERFPKYKQLE